jgi:hypothetical protein
MKEPINKINRVNLNSEVSKFLNDLKHPLRTEIDQLRSIILNSVKGLSENIKWNGPNYSFGTEDRITMRIQPPKQIQLIFHRGAKKLAQPKDKIINDRSGLLVWKENDRAVATFKNIDDIMESMAGLDNIVKEWIKATG